MSVLPELRAELASATNRLLATAATLSDADIAAPSRLPGWTRGHVLSHVAQNAGSHLNLLTWARTGIRTPSTPRTRPGPPPSRPRPPSRPPGTWPT
ncbi:maleylpyruvate isomerase N-terminal domain-containing protein [Nonomuraea sp. B12E4]|uniref:maleylpyruvate isomerase N-terminal domain-containing protein n=1 Tax=Nonomuraea sp. B12E4 TaxID=3153564 RepID=UPI00325C7C6C